MALLYHQVVIAKEVLKTGNFFQRWPVANGHLRGSTVLYLLLKRVMGFSSLIVAPEMEVLQIDTLFFLVCVVIYLILSASFSSYFFSVTKSLLFLSPRFISVRDIHLYLLVAFFVVD